MNTETKIQSTARLRSLRMSPRKVRLLIDAIRGKKIADALTFLRFSKKDAARPVLKLLESAAANADHNHAILKETLVVKEAFADGGPTLHRSMPRAFGRASEIRKRTSHITIVLEGDAATTSKNIKKNIKNTNENEIATE